LFCGYKGHFSEVEQMAGELDHTPPSGVDKNELRFTPAFPVGLHIVKRILRFELLAAASSGP
jgi:hypothetical protein